MKKTNRFCKPVAIIGAGPIGIELGVALKRAGVETMHFDAQQIGHTISWWPRETTFFSTTERIEIAGVPIPNTNQGRVTGEQYLAYLRAIVEMMDLRVRTYEPVVDILKEEEGFTLVTMPATGEVRYQVEKVVIASGDMSRPNTLNIPGENLPHVDHYFIDPHKYFQKKLLIVGGRKSAAEAALRCWRAGAKVTLSYRREAFDEKSIKHFILPDLLTQIKLGTIGFRPRTVPFEITPAKVVLQQADGKRVEEPADFVLIMTGYLGDMSLCKAAGINLVGENRAPEHDPATMETNVAGIYLAGTVAGGERKKRYTYFIENCHVHVTRIVQNLTGEIPVVGTLPARRYDLPLEDFEAN